MALEDSESGSRARTATQFATTHWSVVLAAGESDAAQASAALEELCAAYWYPVYACVRRGGYNPEDAQDRTQGFFACLLRRNPFPHLQPAGARFRSFLLTALNHYLVSEWHKDHAQKRGGDRVRIPLDLAEPETRYAIEVAEAITPDAAYERRWAEAVLARALTRLREDQTALGNRDLFEALAPCMTGAENALPYVELAKRLDRTESAVRSAAHRLRRRYGELLRLEVAHTVASPAEVDDELRHLLCVLSGGP
jgi:DNA-directed RNA polymerase specialized sigma24 family protein